MSSVTLELGPELFSFSSFEDWVESAKTRFRRHGVSSHTVGHIEAICVDAKGRVCASGREFMRARDDNSFPVRVYRLVTP